MAAAGWAVAALALLAGVPLFLCMPPWNDVTLHDMVVRTILRGGVPYRDVNVTAAFVTPNGRSIARFGDIA